MSTLQPGLYQHYKGNYYNILGICRHSETFEECVVYQSLYGDYGLWVRPLKLFQETIEHNGQNIPRFKFIRTLLDQAPGIR